MEAKDFYDYLVNRINVEFIPRAGAESGLPTFSLTLSKKMNYEQFSAKVGEELKADPTHLRFTTINAAGKPKSTVKYAQQGTLNNILSPPQYNYNSNAVQKSDALFYEVFEISLKELEQRKSIKVTWLPEGISKEVCRTVHSVGRRIQLLIYNRRRTT